MNINSLRRWLGALDQAASLDQARAQWDTLLDEHQLSHYWGTERFNDAVLYFLGRSALAPHARLAVVLGLVSSLDFNLRLAAGLLDVPGVAVDGEAELDADADPDAVAAVAASYAMIDGTGDCLEIESADPWFHGFVHGRLAEVRGALREDRGNRARGIHAFWNAYLVMCCRWADLDGIGHALENGASPAYDDHLPLTSAAGALGADGCSAYRIEGVTEATYCAVIDALVHHGASIGAASSQVLEAAAAAGNVVMLGHLVSRGARLDDGGGAALVAAAAQMQDAALEWLLDQDIDAPVDLDDALVAAVGSLWEPNVELLIAAGASVHADDEAALRMALTTMPYDLFAGDDHDFIHQRADMVALLLRHGAHVAHPAVAAAARDAPYGAELIAHVLDDEAVDATTKATLQAWLIAADGAPG